MTGSPNHHHPFHGFSVSFLDGYGLTALSKFSITTVKVRTLLSSNILPFKSHSSKDLPPSLLSQSYLDRIPTSYWTQGYHFLNDLSALLYFFSGTARRLKKKSCAWWDKKVVDIFQPRQQILWIIYIISMLSIAEFRWRASCSLPFPGSLGYHLR